jgi:protoporphyrin/coproporphyrin ferrochelatase
MLVTGVVLMTYGSPTDLDDVGAYMTRVRGGREPSPELVAEFQRRYQAIGMSPLVGITQRQAAALEAALNAHDAERSFRVAAGMRFSQPSIGDVVQSLLDAGAQRLLGLILSPQYSGTLMGAYETQLRQAAGSVAVHMVGAWHLNPAVVEALASRVRGELAQFDDDMRDRVPVLMTAHSLPKRVVDREPEYVEQLQETAHAIAQAAELDADRWWFAYQSAGHSPEEWLKPDMLDVLPELAAAGHRQVVVAPVQFLADHLETLYDVDIAGREQALSAGFERFVRVEAPNDAPDFAAALANVVRGELASVDSPARAAALPSQMRR